MSLPPHEQAPRKASDARVDALLHPAAPAAINGGDILHQTSLSDVRNATSTGKVQLASLTIDGLPGTKTGPTGRADQTAGQPDTPTGKKDSATGPKLTDGTVPVGDRTQTALNGDPKPSDARPTKPHGAPDKVVDKVHPKHTEQPTNQPKDDLGRTVTKGPNDTTTYGYKNLGGKNLSVTVDKDGAAIGAKDANGKDLGIIAHKEEGGKPVSYTLADGTTINHQTGMRTKDLGNGSTLTSDVQGRPVELTRPQPANGAPEKWRTKGGPLKGEVQPEPEPPESDRRYDVGRSRPAKIYHQPKQLDNRRQADAPAR